MAQTERRGGAGPVRSMFSGKPSPAARLGCAFAQTRIPNTSSSLVEASLKRMAVSVGDRDPARREVEAAALAEPGGAAVARARRRPG